jgi:AraC-like DNA-binding protein
MLHYTARPPVPALTGIVEYVWASRGAADARQRVVPTGTLELFVSLTDARAMFDEDDTLRASSVVPNGRSFSGAGVAGAYRHPFVFDTYDNASVVGVHFRPGRAGDILGVPPGELMDRHLDLADLWGRAAYELRERLCAASTTSARFALLEAALVSRLEASRLRVHPAIGYAVGELARPDTRVRDIAKTIGITQRRLIELFTATVGITPKRFGRVLRFHRATALARDNALDWTRIAHQCGYYDQAHLIRDFRELAELTPTDVMRASVHVHEHHQLAIAKR